MLSLNLLARNKLFFALESKSFFKIIGSPLYRALKFHEVTRPNGTYKRCYRRYSTEIDKKELAKSQGSGKELPRNTIETVKETTKTVTYCGVIVIGLGITGFLLYTIFGELFSANSASNIYSKALDRCLKNDKVVLSLGEPIKAFGEENLRGRRRHTNHLLYEKDGITYLRMKFYIKGSRKKATVHLEMKQNENKDFDYRYLFVQLDEYPYTTIVLEDNRMEKSTLVSDSMELSQ